MAFRFLILEIHYGGFIRFAPNMQNVDGFASYYNNYDWDEMSLIKLENLTNDLDCQRIEYFYYLVLG